MEKNILLKKDFKTLNLGQSNSFKRFKCIKTSLHLLYYSPGNRSFNFEKKEEEIKMELNEKKKKFMEKRKKKEKNREFFFGKTEKIGNQIYF